MKNNQEEFTARVDALATKWDISAVLLMENREGVMLEKAYGYADRKAGRKMTLQDRFCLSAHVNFFLGLCVLHLYEAGKFSLNAKVGEWIPEYKTGAAVTVSQLLRAESGIPDELYQVRIPALQKDPAHAALSNEEKFQREFEEKVKDVSFEEVLRHIEGKELDHIPGQEDDGNTTAISFLAEIIRRASGLLPREYLMQHIFRPLGMEDTRPGNDETVMHQGCMGDDQLVPLPRAEARHCFTTTLSDMNKLARAIAEKRLFSEKTMKLALKCKREFCGLGFCKQGDLYFADEFPSLAGDYLRMYFQFEEGMSWVYLLGEELISRHEENEWRAFSNEVRRAWQYERAYPKKPELKKVTGKNVWDAMEIQIRPEQLSFVPDAKSCIASSLAHRQPVYVLMDHGLPVGIAALTIKPRQKEYHVSFLQVDHRLQGRGYGRILLTHAVRLLKEAGAKKLEIGVNRFNIPAQKLYMSVGFQLDTVYEGFMRLKMEL
ncbi:MAG: GNAT family N-acetyltransferase [Clostridiales bacterium]|nr:GNAT family N-acetyltransferase [Clostridiales bacterium]